MEEDTEITVGPHLICIYKNKDIIQDAADLIIHHVKQQTDIQKEDKQKIKQLIKQFIPDLFSVPRGELSDDEIDKDEDTDEDKNSKTNNACHDQLSLKMSRRNSSCNDGNDPLKSEVDVEYDKVALENLPKTNLQSSASTTATVETSLPGDSYALMFIDNYWFYFFQMHYMLCERLTNMYEYAQNLLAEEQRTGEENKKSEERRNKRLKTESSVSVHAYYTTLLDMLKNLLDGNIESNQYEDTLREMYGINAYLAFTLDKVVQNAVGHLQHIVADENCTQCTAIFLEEQKNIATGGPCAFAAQHSNAEVAYQKRTEQMLANENCYKLMIYKNEGKLTIELLDNNFESSEEEWADNMENYASEYDDAMPDEIMEVCKNEGKVTIELLDGNFESSEDECDEWVEDMENYGPGCADCDNEDDEEHMTNWPVLLFRNARSKIQHNKDCSKNRPSREFRFYNGMTFGCNVNSYKMYFGAHSESFLYKRMSLKKAHQSHRRVSEKLNQHFKSWHKAWLNKNVTEEQNKWCHNWLLGLTEDSKLTTCIKIDDPSKAPYAPFNCYKVLGKL